MVDLEYIEIDGLLGGKSTRIEFNHDVKIFIGANGSGKTTVLKVIYSLLNKDWEYLEKVSFDAITVKFKSMDEATIFKSDVYAYLLDSKPEFWLLELDMLPRVENACDIKVSDYIHLSEIKMEEELRKLCKAKRVREGVQEKFIEESKDFRIQQLAENGRKEHIEELNKYLLKYDSIEIVYLPTYRRIEENLEITHNQFLNCNMSDVKANVSDLMSKIKDIVYQKEQQISSDIFEQEASKVLNEFKELRKNIKAERALFDDKIHSFVKICSKYLADKQFIYNERELMFKIVKKDDTDVTIELDTLSSGEQQIVSLFCQLYLTDIKDKIIIMDEPETSLSVWWQETLLVDIMKSKRCKLLVVATHSPFIFDNEYNEYAEKLILQ
ncbi:MAG: hypothetical protein ATN35_09300 [Epulopiscium sp. Nele67-Bin004]|nr:MAG: hypothetical protein ATN35_09300 [Epulopiscium sp. Nele67-Bin004]